MFEPTTTARRFVIAAPDFLATMLLPPLLEAARRAAVVKLRHYYRQMGFERIGRSSYYGLSMARKSPTLADLLRPGR